MKKMNKCTGLSGKVFLLLLYVFLSYISSASFLLADEISILETSAPVGKIHGEFSVTPDGAAQYIIPIKVPKGRKNIQPDLAFQYNSRGGDGNMGIRWSLTGLSSIKRIGKNYREDGERQRVQFNHTDLFSLDGKQLVAISGGYGQHRTEYRTKNESFSKII